MIFTGTKPIYEALADNFRKLIHHGVFKEGDALPSVREVALQERINPNTVVRAYSLLTEEGIIVSIPKKGYFVASKVNKDQKHLHAVLSCLFDDGYTREDIESMLNILQGDAHD